MQASTQLEVKPDEIVFRMRVEDPDLQNHVKAHTDTKSFERGIGQGQTLLETDSPTDVSGAYHGLYEEDYRVGQMWREESDDSDIYLWVSMEIGQTYDEMDSRMIDIAHRLVYVVLPSVSVKRYSYDGRTVDIVDTTAKGVDGPSATLVYDPEGYWWFDVDPLLMI